MAALDTVSAYPLSCSVGECLLELGTAVAAIVARFVEDELDFAVNPPISESKSGGRMPAIWVIWRDWARNGFGSRPGCAADDKLRRPRPQLLNSHHCALRRFLRDLTRFSEASDPIPVSVHLPAAETAVRDRDRVIMRSLGFHRDRVAYQGD
jgi:hypothetical protein